MQKLLSAIPENLDPDGMMTLARYNLKLYERKDQEALEVLRRSPLQNLHGQTNAPLPKSFLAGDVYRLIKDEARARAANWKEEAPREGRRAVELLPETEDAVDGPTFQISLARIYLMVGEPDQAIALLEHLVSIPSGLSAHELRIDPTRDSVRRDRRFQKLVAAAK